MKVSAAENLLHDFRVEYKKTRALIRLSTKSKIPAFLKNLYSAAGKVRELQLLRHMLLQLTTEEKIPHYLSFLNQKYTAAIEQLKKEAGLNHHHSIKKLQHKLPVTLSKKKAAGFVNKQLNHLTLLIQVKKKREEDLHEARKLVKDLLYTFFILRQTGLKKSIPFPHHVIEQWHTLSDELGKFQDLCNFLLYLKQVSILSSSPEENNLLKQIKADYLQIKRQKKKVIFATLTTLLAENQHKG